MTHKILGINQEIYVELFFNSAHRIKNQCIIYHLAKIKGENAVVKGEFNKWLFNLRRGYKTSYMDNSSVNESQVDGIYTPYSYIRWSFCQEGLVCLYSDTNNHETNEFLSHVFKTNLKREYLYIYILLLHQRELLLSFLEQLVQPAQNEYSKLKEVKEQLILSKTRYTYNVISNEMTYQNIYLKIGEVLAINSLFEDLQNMTDRIIMLEQDKKNEEELTKTKKINSALSIITMLTIFFRTCR